jgi:hypothetical protein
MIFILSIEKVNDPGASSEASKPKLKNPFRFLKLFLVLKIILAIWATI